MPRVIPEFKKFSDFKRHQRRVSFDAETQLIIMALKRAGGNRTRAAQMLGYKKGSRSSLYRAIDLHPSIQEALEKMDKPVRRR